MIRRRRVVEATGVCLSPVRRGKESSMPSSVPTPRIGIFGTEKPATQTGRGCGLWPPGYAAAVTAAGGAPVMLTAPKTPRSWDGLLEDLDGIVFLGGAADS